MGDKKYKDKHKAQGLCVDCSERASPRNTRCETHRKWLNKYTKQHYQKNRQRRSISDKKRYYELKKEGVCCNCAKPLDADADYGNVACINCRERISRTNRRNYAIA